MIKPDCAVLFNHLIKTLLTAIKYSGCECTNLFHCLAFSRFYVSLSVSLYIHERHNNVSLDDFEGKPNKSSR